MILIQFFGINHFKRTNCFKLSFEVHKNLIFVVVIRGAFDTDLQRSCKVEEDIQFPK